MCSNGNILVVVMVMVVLVVVKVLILMEVFMEVMNHDNGDIAG